MIEQTVNLMDCRMPVSDEDADKSRRFAYVYRYILSNSWGQGTPLPRWRELWANIVEPKMADLEEGL